MACEFCEFKVLDIGFFKLGYDLASGIKLISSWIKNQTYYHVGWSRAKTWDHFPTSFFIDAGSEDKG